MASIVIEECLWNYETLAKDQRTSSRIAGTDLQSELIRQFAEVACIPYGQVVTQLFRKLRS